VSQEIVVDVMQSLRQGPVMTPYITSFGFLQDPSWPDRFAERSARSTEERQAAWRRIVARYRARAAVPCADAAACNS
jgi:hypothetical protein